MCHDMRNKVLPFPAPQPQVLVRVKDGVAGTRLKYREDYSSAERIRANFNSDLASPFGHNLAANMFLLGLPRFEDVKADFLDLCRRHGLEDDL